MSIDEQVENLKSLGLVISDENYARHILNDISYFRLIKASMVKILPWKWYQSQVGLYIFIFHFLYI